MTELMLIAILDALAKLFILGWLVYLTLKLRTR